MLIGDASFTRGSARISGLLSEIASETRTRDEAPAVCSPKGPSSPSWRNHEWTDL